MSFASLTCLMLSWWRQHSLQSIAAHPGLNLASLYAFPENFTALLGTFVDRVSSTEQSQKTEGLDMVSLISRALVLYLGRRIRWATGVVQGLGMASQSSQEVSKHGLCASLLGLRATFLWAEQGAANGGAI